MISQAKNFCIERHQKQKRKLMNEPYYKHPIRVAFIVKKFESEKKEMIVAAYLHDILEDTETKKEELIELFGKKVTNLVVELTSDKNKVKENKVKYLSEKMSNPKKMSDDALTIKLADRLDNVMTDNERNALNEDLSFKEGKFFSRYKKETEDILDYIEEKRDLSNLQLKLVEMIRRELR